MCLLVLVMTCLFFCVVQVIMPEETDMLFLNASSKGLDTILVRVGWGDQDMDGGWNQSCDCFVS